MGPYIQEEKTKKDKNYLNRLPPAQVANVKGFAMFLNLSEFKDVGFLMKVFSLFEELICVND